MKPDSATRIPTGNYSLENVTFAAAKFVIMKANGDVCPAAKKDIVG
jgi:hypothetical protein